MADATKKPEGDAGASQVQAAIDEEQEKGYRGETPDPTPNENYTANKSDAPTPETDPKLAAKAREARG